MSINPDDPQATAKAAAQPVEKKVTASTVTAGGILALILAVLSVVENDQLVEGLPDWVSVLVGTIVAAGGTYLAGHQAPHTPRPDLPADQR
jgi:uncharacterized membrane protein YccC